MSFGFGVGDILLVAQLANSSANGSSTHPRCRLQGQIQSNTIVLFLIEMESVDADSEDDDNRTPLSWASSHGHLGVVKPHCHGQRERAI